MFAAAACAWFAWAGTSSSLQAELQPDQLYSAVSPSIVALDVENVSGKHFVGTAFLAAGSGLAVTAWHVVHDARRVEARFSDNHRVTVIGLVDKNEKLDLALLQLAAGSRPRITLSASTPRIGSRVYLVGSPRGLDFSISEGLISQIRTLDGVRYYQLSCPISPGDSGGPVLNDRGEAIGVVSWRKADAESIGFAIPSSMIKNVMRQLIENGKVTRGYLGVAIQGVDEKLANVTARYTIGLGLFEVLLGDDRIEDIYVDAPSRDNPIHVTVGGIKGSGTVVRCQTNIVASSNEIEGLVSRFRQYSRRPFSEAFPVLETDVVGFDARATFIGINSVGADLPNSPRHPGIEVTVHTNN